MPTPFRSASRTGALFGGVIGQQSVLRAMMLRELQARFGRDNIGYLWVIAEPMMLASAVTLLHLLIEPGEGSGGMGVYPFSLLGYCLFIIFRNTFNRADGMINGSVNLMYHAQITPFDIVFSKAAVDALAALSALIVLMTVGIILGLALPPARPIYVLGAALAMSTMTFGLSMLIAATTYRYHAIGRLVHPFSYIMFPLSGAFITMAFLPAWARPYMAWNPLMQIFELARYGYFVGATDKYIDAGYIVAVCTISVYLGLIALRRVRRDINVH